MNRFANADGMAKNYYRLGEKGSKSSKWIKFN